MLTYKLLQGRSGEFLQSSIGSIGSPDTVRNAWKTDAPRVLWVRSVFEVPGTITLLHPRRREHRRQVGDAGFVDLHLFLVERDRRRRLSSPMNVFVVSRF
jgi:hypothetical protein